MISVKDLSFVYISAAQQRIPITKQNDWSNFCPKKGTDGHSGVKNRVARDLKNTKIKFT